MDKYIWTYSVNGVGLEAKELCIIGDEFYGKRQRNNVHFL